MTREKKNNNGLSSAPSSLNVIIYPIVAIGGSFLGLFLVLITNRTLLEITFSPVFAVIIGLLFEALAICLLYRVVSLHREEATWSTKLFIFIFCGVILIAGCMCILLDGDLSEYSFLSKTIIYGWIATVSLFILNYFLLEFMFIGLFTCSCADRSLSRSVLSYPLIVCIYWHSECCQYSSWFCVWYILWLIPIP
jgi:sensor histidine kinase YesM